MVDEGGPRQKTIAEQGREFVGRSGIPGDVTNNLEGLRLYLDLPELWPEIKSVGTYEQYFRENKFDWNLPVAEAVIAASDQTLVNQYNEVVRQINEEIGTGVTTQEQATRIAELIAASRKLITGS